MKKPHAGALLTALVLLSANVFAESSAKTPTSASSLTKEQISEIQKACSKANAGSMTSTAYKDCVKAKEDEAVAAHQK